MRRSNFTTPAALYRVSNSFSRIYFVDVLRSVIFLVHSNYFQFSEHYYWLLVLVTVENGKATRCFPNAVGQILVRVIVIGYPLSEVVMILTIYASKFRNLYVEIVALIVPRSIYYEPWRHHEGRHAWDLWL